MSADEDKEAQAMVELHEKVLMHKEAATRLQQQERMTLMVKNRTHLTVQELESMPDDIGTYKAVGKAYFFKPKAAIMSELKDRIFTAATEAESLKVQREAVEAKFRESDNELAELLRVAGPALARMGTTA